MQKLSAFNISIAIVYIIIVVCITFFTPSWERRRKICEYHFVPLQSTIAQIKDPAQYNTPGYWRIFATGILGNFFLFMPFGFLSVILFSKKKKTTLFMYALVASISIELIQLIFHLGVCDIDDVILNSLGALSGIFLSATFFSFKMKSLQKFRA